MDRNIERGPTSSCLWRILVIIYPKTNLIPESFVEVFVMSVCLLPIDDHMLGPDRMGILDIGGGAREQLYPF